MIAVIWPPLKKKRAESRIAQTTTADGALDPGCREACHALDASFEALKNPRFQARGFFLWRSCGRIWKVAFSRTTDFETGKFNDKYRLRRFSDRRVSITLASQKAATWAALLLLRYPSHGHGTFDDVPPNPVAS
jgi:hypothetical protein